MTNPAMTKEIERRRGLWPSDAVTIIDALVMEITRLQQELQASTQKCEELKTDLKHTDAAWQASVNMLVAEKCEELQRQLTHYQDSYKELCEENGKLEAALKQYAASFAEAMSVFNRAEDLDLDRVNIHDLMVLVSKWQEIAREALKHE